jgi:2-isopropylmalate synthase
VHDDAKPQDEFYVLDGLQVACGTQGMATATVRLRAPDGEVQVRAAVGTGPVDAAYKAIDALIDVPSELLEFSVRAVTEGIDALGEVTVRVRANARLAATNAQHDNALPHVFHGTSADTDIIVASAKAYLKAINRMLAALGYVKPASSRSLPNHAAGASVAEEGRP